MGLHMHAACIEQRTHFLIRRACWSLGGAFASALRLGDLLQQAVHISLSLYSTMNTVCENSQRWCTTQGLQCAQTRACKQDAKLGVGACFAQDMQSKTDWVGGGLLIYISMLEPDALRGGTDQMARISTFDKGHPSASGAAGDLEGHPDMYARDKGQASAAQSKTPTRLAQGTCAEPQSC